MRRLLATALLAAGIAHAQSTTNDSWQILARGGDTNEYLLYQKNNIRSNGNLKYVWIRTSTNWQLVNYKGYFSNNISRIKIDCSNFTYSYMYTKLMMAKPLENPINVPGEEAHFFNGTEVYSAEYNSTEDIVMKAVCKS